jgi:hypothetical protein
VMASVSGNSNARSFSYLLCELAIAPVAPGVHFAHNSSLSSSEGNEGQLHHHQLGRSVRVHLAQRADTYALGSRPACAALSAWELDCHASVTGTFQVNRHHWLSVSAREVPLLTTRSSTRRARDAWRTSVTTTDP